MRILVINKIINNKYNKSNNTKTNIILITVFYFIPYFIFIHILKLFKFMSNQTKHNIKQLFINCNLNY